ncbi:MAG: hypothetical protein ABUK01_14455 [Leptospirales bacterium]
MKLLQARFIRIVALFFLASVFSITYAGARNYQSNLDDSLLLKRFQKISTSLTCICGCNLVLHTCNMDPCEGWAIRGAIDGLLLDGKNNKFIIEGFVYGFGDMVDTHTAFKLVQPGGRYEFLNADFKKGYGPMVRAITDVYHYEIVLAIIALILLGSALMFIKSRFREVTVSEKTEKQKISSETDELYNKLYDDE